MIVYLPRKTGRCSSPTVYKTATELNFMKRPHQDQRHWASVKVQWSKEMAIKQPIKHNSYQSSWQEYHPYRWHHSVETGDSGIEPFMKRPPPRHQLSQLSSILLPSLIGVVKPALSPSTYIRSLPVALGFTSITLKISLKMA